LKPSVLKSFVEKKKTVTFPEQSFDSVAPSSAEKKQCAPDKWIHFKLLLYDFCQSVNSFAKICISAGKENGSAFSCIKIIKHGSSPPKSAGVSDQRRLEELPHGNSFPLP
jgi:hypothetical protein